jgi:predicted SAM-dependent methyltransferase
MWRARTGTELIMQTAFAKTGRHMISSRNYIKGFSTAGLRSAVRQVFKEWRLCQRHRRSVSMLPRFLENSPLKLDLGSGSNNKQGWLNIDLFHPSADLQLDLREAWPFPNGSVLHIYSEHVFEHFEFHREVPHFLSESLRVLRPGGIFDVGVPDSEWPIRAYGNSAEEYWRLAETQWHPKWCETQLDHINYHFRQDGEHQYAWDEETLARSLRRAGFTSIIRR